MKEIKLLIPEGQRIGEAIYEAISEEWARSKSIESFPYYFRWRVKQIEDQDLLSLLSKPK